jgi:predicted CoA-binding protein
MDAKLLQEFLRRSNCIAVIGASRNPAKYGHQVYRDLRTAGYRVYAVNPGVAEVLGDRCYPSLHALPEKPDVVSTVVPPAVTEMIVDECKVLGIDKVWMQPGSESEEAIEFCRRHHIKVVFGACVMLKRREPEVAQS